MQRNVLQFCYGSLAGACFVGFLAMFAISSLSWTDKAAMLGFSVSIPLNVFIFLCPVPEPGYELAWAGKVYVCILNFGRLSGIAALSLLFAHFGWIYGAVFASSSALVYILTLFLAGVLAKDSPNYPKDDDAA